MTPKVYQCLPNIGLLRTFKSQTTPNRSNTHQNLSMKPKSSSNTRNTSQYEKICILGTSSVRPTPVLCPVSVGVGGVSVDSQSGCSGSRGKCLGSHSPRWHCPQTAPASVSANVPSAERPRGPASAQKYPSSPTTATPAFCPCDGPHPTTGRRVGVELWD